MIKNCWSESKEVLYSRETIASMTRADIETLKKLADANERDRVRICFHESPKDQLHEMVIIHKKNCYLRPHFHKLHNESIDIIEGEADLVLFTATGAVKNVFELGPPHSKKAFYHRNNRGDIHTFLIRTDYLVFKEVTRGPFVAENVIYPSWAPNESSPNSISFRKQLEKDVTAFLDGYQ